MAEVSVVILYTDKLNRILVNGEEMDISAISSQSIEEWFQPSSERNGWKGFLQEVKDVVGDDEA